MVLWTPLVCILPFLLKYRSEILIISISCDMIRYLWKHSDNNFDFSTFSTKYCKEEQNIKGKLFSFFIKKVRPTINFRISSLVFLYFRIYPSILLSYWYWVYINYTSVVSIILVKFSIFFSSFLFLQVFCQTMLIVIYEIDDFYAVNTHSIT